MEVSAINQTEMAQLFRNSFSIAETDNKAKSVIGHFEKMIMKSMLKPLEKSLINSSSHFSAVSMDFVMEHLAQQFASEFNFGLENYYQKSE